MDAACRYACGHGTLARDYARVLDPTPAPIATAIIRRAALTGIETVDEIGIEDILL